MFRRWGFSFEKLGRLYFANTNLFLFLFLLLVPPFLSTAFLLYQNSCLDSIKERYCTAIKKGRTALDRKSRKERFLDRHTRPDPYYLDTEIEAFPLLAAEQRRLQTWIAHPAIPNKQGLKERLLYLESGENSLSFAEEEIQRSDLCKETLERQRNPVELDAEDLASLLSLIEERIAAKNEKSQQPQLLITDFSLHKTSTPIQNEVFEIRMDLLKREFL